MKAAIVLALALIGAGCATSEMKPTSPPAPRTGGVPQPYTVTDADRAAIEAGTRAYLQNPANATFRTMLATTGTDGAVTACGYVNLGAGDKPYIGTLAGGAFTVTGMGGATADTIAVQQRCQSSRVYI